MPRTPSQAQRHDVVDDENGDERLFVPLLRVVISASSARARSSSENAYRALSTLIVLYRFVLVGFTCVGLEIIPLAPTAFEQLRPLRAGILPFKFREGKIRFSIK